MDDDNDGIKGRLLRRHDFQSPLLYKVYQYMLQVYLSHFYEEGVAMSVPLPRRSIRGFFKEEELRRMIELFLMNKHMMFMDLLDGDFDSTILRKYYNCSGMREWINRSDIDHDNMMDYLLRMTVGPCFRKDKGLCFDYGELCIDDMNVASYQMSVLDSLFFRIDRRIRERKHKLLRMICSDRGISFDLVRSMEIFL